MSNVISIHGKGITDHSLNPDAVLDNLKGELSSFVLAGYDKNNNEFFSMTMGDGGEALWLIERFKAALLSGDDSQ